MPPPKLDINEILLKVVLYTPVLNSLLYRVS